MHSGHHAAFASLRPLHVEDLSSCGLLLRVFLHNMLFGGYFCCWWTWHVSTWDFGLLAIKLIFPHHDHGRILVRLVVHLLEDLGSTLSALRPSDFRMIFQQAPACFACSSLWGAGWCETLTSGQLWTKMKRMAMAKRNQWTPQERGFVALATPQSSPILWGRFFQNRNQWAGQWERHFWDVFHKVPMSTTDPTKWKSVLKFLDSCPEKVSFRDPTARGHWFDFCWVEWFWCSLAGFVPPRADLGGMDALRAMAVFPRLQRTREDSSDFHEFVKRRVDTDTGKIWPSATLSLTPSCIVFAGRKNHSCQGTFWTLSPLEAMSDLYQTVFKIYMRKLERLIPKLGARSKEKFLSQQVCWMPWMFSADDSEKCLNFACSAFRTLGHCEEGRFWVGLGDRVLSAALRAALDLVLLFTVFVCFLFSRRSLHDHFLLLKLAGSLWLMLIRTMPSKRKPAVVAVVLVQIRGEHGWQFLEQGPCFVCDISFFLFVFSVWTSFLCWWNC